MDFSHSRRRLSRTLAAGALALPLALTAVAAPAPAAVLVDQPFPYGSSYGHGYGSIPSYGYGDFAPPYGYGGYGAYASGTALQTDTTEATPDQSAGLVEIDTTIDYGQGEAAGTGIVMRSDGIVVTNHHVVEGATSIRATVVTTGRTYTARLLGYDSAKDVAVLRLVGASGLQAVATDVSGVAVGQDVTAVGDANGDGGALTAAPGQVTDTRTPITVTGDDGKQTRLTGLVEVTSDIVPGDSGGALLDDSGRVVGMNVAASSGTADITGYVIPIARVLRVEQQVLAGDDSGTVEVGYDAFLGVELASGATAPVVSGLVDGGPAAAAGIPSGSSITSVDGRAVTSGTALRRLLATLNPGDRVRVAWTTRSGDLGSAEVALARAPIA